MDMRRHMGYTFAMTSYFDSKANELREFQRAGKTIYDETLRSWVLALLNDMALVGEFDRGGEFAFPDYLRDALYTLALRTVPEAWPGGLKGYGVDYETDEQGYELLRQFVEGCHDIFHAAAHAGWPGRDSPRTPIQVMVGRMEERQAELIAKTPALNLDTRVSPPSETP